MSEGGYIQGAGDDSEGWSQGLTASLFWQHKTQLSKTSEEELPDLISKLLETKSDARMTSKAILITPTTWLFAGSLDILHGTERETPGVLVTCGEAAQLPANLGTKSRHIHLECRKGKVGSRELRKQLNKILPLFVNQDSPKKVFICCPTGKDLSIGVVLAVLCLFTDDSGKYLDTLVFITNMALICNRKFDYESKSFSNEQNIY
jgi:tRNA A64-2'-O-ribosylphosphate transferase